MFTELTEFAGNFGCHSERVFSVVKVKVIKHALV